MDAKLREFLRKSGVSETNLDRLERGEAPDGDKLLAKGSTNQTLETCAKACNLLDEIKASLSRIENADAQRGPAARGVELNGFTHPISDMLKGTK